MQYNKTFLLKHNMKIYILGKLKRYQKNYLEGINIYKIFPKRMACPCLWLEVTGSKCSNIFKWVWRALDGAESARFLDRWVSQSLDMQVCTMVLQEGWYSISHLPNYWTLKRFYSNISPGYIVSLYTFHCRHCIHCISWWKLRASRLSNEKKRLSNEFFKHQARPPPKKKAQRGKITATLDFSTVSFPGKQWIDL